MGYQDPEETNGEIAKGKRFSTLVSGRDSVLNSLVDSPLWFLFWYIFWGFSIKMSIHDEKMWVLKFDFLF